MLTALWTASTGMQAQQSYTQRKLGAVFEKFASGLICHVHSLIVKLLNWILSYWKKINQGRKNFFQSFFNFFSFR